MSNLQVGLAVAGAILLAAVVVQGVWSTRQSTPKQALPEPHLDGVTVPSAMSSDLDDGAFDAASVSSALLTRQQPAMDVLIDVIATIALEAPVTSVLGDTALAVMPTTRRVGSKPFAVEGYNLARLVWESPMPGQRYGGFQAGVQLANRFGPLNEIEYSEFVVKTQAFADAINATAEFPEMLEEVARARELDQFASDHDAQLSFTIRATQASWSVAYVHQNAAHLGFVPAAVAGRMVIPAREENTPAVLVLSFDPHAAMSDDSSLSAIREIALHLDVPQVDRAEHAFERMCEIATRLAQTMEGVVTDDNAQVLTAQAMNLIGAELQILYDNLEQRDFAAGSPLARRLFS